MKNLFYSLAVILLLCIFLIEGQFFLKPLALAAMIAISINPVVAKLMKWVKYHWLSFLILLIIFLLVSSLLLYLISDQILSLFADLNTEKYSIQELADSVAGILQQLGLTYGGIDEYITMAISSVADIVGSFLMSSITATGESIFTATLTLIFTYYFSSYYPDLKQYALQLFKNEDSQKVRMIMTEVPKVVRAYLQGVSKVMVILGIVMTIFYFIIGLKYALIWGILTGLLVFIPYIGSFFALLLPLSYCLITVNSATMPLSIIAFYFLVQQIEGNFLTPKIVGNKVDLNPFTTIIILLISAKIWGLLGIFLCIPLGGMIKIAFEAWETTEPIANIMSEDVNERRR